MVTCYLTLVDWFTKKETKKVITPANPEKAAMIHSKLNPNASVLLKWNNGDKVCKISLRPYNMETDLLAVEDGESLMSLDQFTKKWYGKISKAKLKEIEKEVIEEFTTQDEE